MVVLEVVLITIPYGSCGSDAGKATSSHSVAGVSRRRVGSVTALPSVLVCVCACVCVRHSATAAVLPLLL